MRSRKTEEVMGRQRGWSIQAEAEVEAERQPQENAVREIWRHAGREAEGGKCTHARWHSEAGAVRCRQMQAGMLVQTESGREERQRHAGKGIGSRQACIGRHSGERKKRNKGRGREEDAVGGKQEHRQGGRGRYSSRQRGSQAGAGRQEPECRQAEGQRHRGGRRGRQAGRQGKADRNRHVERQRDTGSRRKNKSCVNRVFIP
jgi:hypothetical protein